MVKKIKIKDKNKDVTILKVEWVDEFGTKIMDVDKAVDSVVLLLMDDLEDRVKALEQTLKAKNDNIKEIQKC